MLAFFGLSANAQECLSGGCSNFNNQYPSGTLTPTTSWTTKTAMNGGNWTLFNVICGNIYEWTYCEAYGGVSTNWDAQLTLYDNSNLTTQLCYSDDYCGNNADAPYIQWTATFTGTVRLLTSVYNCATNAPNPPFNTLVYRQAGSCTGWSVSPTSASYTASGGSGSFNVSTTIGGCSFTYSSNASWINNITWSGVLNYNVDANTTYSLRTGYIYIYNGCTSSLVATFTVTEDGLTAPEISLSGNMNFGNVQVGNTSQQTLTITNTGNATLNVSSIAYPTGFTGSWSGNITSGNYHNVTVTFTPSSAITYGGIITINSNATSGTNTISCSGTGTQSSTMPDLEITYPGVNITYLIPLASTQITYTINNIGNGVAGSSITSFFLSTNDVFNAGVDTWIKDDNIPSIAASGNVTHTVTVSIPDNTPTGLWYVIIIVDAPDNIVEVTNANNVSFVSVNVSDSISCDVNTFPYGDGTYPCSVGGDAWDFIKYQCVSYVAWKVNEFFGETSITLPSNQYPFRNDLFGTIQAPNCYTGGNYRLSDACYWAPILEYHEVTVDNIPSVGSIAHWQSNMNGAHENGHVAYVSSVSGSMICITEYNWGTNLKCKFNYRTIDMTSDPNRPTSFIHIEASGLGSGQYGIAGMTNTEQDIIVYPNPTTDFLNIEIGDGLKDEELTFSLFNIFGQLAYEEKITSSLSTFSIQFLPTGYYIYKITDRAGIKNIGKIIKY